MTKRYYRKLELADELYHIFEGKFPALIPNTKVIAQFIYETQWLDDIENDAFQAGYRQGFRDAEEY